MRIVLIILAGVGAAAVLWHIVRAVLRLLRGGLDALFAGQVEEVRARRGDLTGMADAASRRALARRRRWVALATLSFWVVLLLVPPLTPWPLLLYALYSVLWLVPHDVARS